MGSGIDAGKRFRRRFVESTVNYVISKRFVKRQSMQWTKRGAHLLLQTRVKTLNNELASTFRRWYPDFPMENTALAALIPDILMASFPTASSRRQPSCSNRHLHERRRTDHQTASRSTRLSSRQARRKSRGSKPKRSLRRPSLPCRSARRHSRFQSSPKICWTPHQVTNLKQALETAAGVNQYSATGPFAGTNAFGFQAFQIRGISTCWTKPLSKVPIVLARMRPSARPRRYC